MKYFDETSMKQQSNSENRNFKLNVQNEYFGMVNKVFHKDLILGC